MWYRVLRMLNISQWRETGRSQSYGSKDGRAINTKTAQKLNISQGSVYSRVYDSLVFQKDCATAHITIILQTLNWELLDQIAYCPDLAPSHFYLLWTPKKGTTSLLMTMRCRRWRMTGFTHKNLLVWCLWKYCTMMGKVYRKARRLCREILHL